MDQDRDGWPEELDCDDQDPDVFPAADDVPDDGIDQDCSGSDSTRDESGGERSTGGSSSSGGTVGASGGEPAAAGGAGTGGLGGANVGTDRDQDGFVSAVDCDDDDVGVHPGAFDIPWDDIDQDCSGSDSRDGDGDGFDGGNDGEDCDDTRSEVSSIGIEVILNDVDENCDGSDIMDDPELPDVLGAEAVVAEPPDLALVTYEGAPALLLVWVDARSGSPRDLFAQVVDFEGNPLGDEIEIDTLNPDPKTGVHIAVGGSGYLVSWLTGDGGWVRQLDPDGAPAGIVLGIADAGAENLSAAFGGEELEGGGTWGITWTNHVEPAERNAFFRSMTLDEIRGEIVRLGEEDKISTHVSLTGTDEGFLTVREGELGSKRGMIAERLSRLGDVLGDPWLLREGAVGEPTISGTGPGYSVVFRVPGNWGYIAGLKLDDAFDVRSEAVQLSTESGSQHRLELESSESGHLVLWNDGRHLVSAPPADAVYGQLWSTNSEGKERTYWRADRALYAGDGGRLGGAIVHENVAYVAMQIGDEAGVVLRPL